MASWMAGNAALKGIHQQLKTKMDSTVEDFRGHLLAARTGRANVHMLDQVKVDYYGTDTPVAQMGQVSTPEPTLILVQPYDMGMVSAIEKAIRTSGTGLNPMSDGKVIRVPVPPMTEERRNRLMSSEDLVEAALSGLDQGELVTLPSLPDKAEWDGYEAARQRMIPNLLRPEPAERYRSAPQT